MVIQASNATTQASRAKVPRRTFLKATATSATATSLLAGKRAVAQQLVSTGTQPRLETDTVRKLQEAVGSIGLPVDEKAVPIIGQAEAEAIMKAFESSLVDSEGVEADVRKIITVKGNTIEGKNPIFVELQEPVTYGDNQYARLFKITNQGNGDNPSFVVESPYSHADVFEKGHDQASGLKADFVDPNTGKAKTHKIYFDESLDRPVNDAPKGITRVPFRDTEVFNGFDDTLKRDRQFLTSDLGQELNSPDFVRGIKFDENGQPVLTQREIDFFKKQLSEFFAKRGARINFTKAIAIENTSEYFNPSNTALLFYEGRAEAKGSDGHPIKPNVLRVYYKTSPEGFQVRNSYNGKLVDLEGGLKQIDISYAHGRINQTDEFVFDPEFTAPQSQRTYFGEKADDGRGVVIRRRMPADHIKIFE